MNLPCYNRSRKCPDWTLLWFALDCHPLALACLCGLLSVFALSQVC